MMDSHKSRTRTRLFIPSFHSLANALLLFLTIRRQVEEGISGLEEVRYVLINSLHPRTPEIEVEHAHRFALLNEFLNLFTIFVRQGFVIDYRQRCYLVFGSHSDLGIKKVDLTDRCVAGGKDPK